MVTHIHFCKILSGLWPDFAQSSTSLCGRNHTVDSWQECLGQPTTFLSTWRVALCNLQFLPATPPPSAVGNLGLFRARTMACVARKSLSAKVQSEQQCRQLGASPEKSEDASPLAEHVSLN